VTPAVDSYRQFLASKRLVAPSAGIDVDPAALHPAMKPHQRAVTSWALRKGRAACWLDTGLGKSFVALEWAAQLASAGAAPRTLLLSPLGVAQQTVRDEAPRWGYTATYARSEAEAPAAGITVTNYERLEAFDLARWPAVVLDEADILANYTGVRKRQLVARCRDVPYKLTLTATPAPNEVVELANQADFLGVMSQQDLLSTFFISKGDDQKSGKFRLKNHARAAFYRWLASWAVACKQPADLGFDNAGYVLPPLSIVPHFVGTDWTPPGYLFLVELKGVVQRAEVRRDTVAGRVARAAALVAEEPAEQWLLWYGLLDEAERIGSLLRAAGLACEVVRGSDSAERKADVLLAFARGDVQIVCTHPKIAGMGMNLQRCARMAFVGLSDSYRQYYQGIRRCWRFGQEREVHAHIVLSDPERPVYDNVLRKEAEAGELTRELVRAMRDYEREELGVMAPTQEDRYAPTRPLVLPDWLRSYEGEQSACC
jgi:superfamily II DNA or RNA helicase